MNRAALYTMIVGLSLCLAVSGTSASGVSVSTVLQFLGGLLAVGAGGVLLRDAFAQSTTGE